MNRETMPTVDKQERGSSERESKKSLGYGEALRRYIALKEVIPEAEQLLFRERPARDARERAVARHELQIGAHEDQAEAFAQQGDYFAEKAMRNFADFKRAELSILRIYCDALEAGSEEFAKILEEEHPWLGKAVAGSEVEHGDERGNAPLPH